MPKPYFRQVPDFEYVDRTPGDKTISNYRNVKNLFRRAKLREDIFEDLSFFTKYKIVGNERPDNVAEKFYEDATLDWVILLSNNIINVYTEWPMRENSFYNFLIIFNLVRILIIFPSTFKFVFNIFEMSFKEFWPSQKAIKSIINLFFFLISVHHLCFFLNCILS